MNTLSLHHFYAQELPARSVVIPRNEAHTISSLYDFVNYISKGTSLIDQNGVLVHTSMLRNFSIETTDDSYIINVPSCKETLDEVISRMLTTPYSGKDLFEYLDNHQTSYERMQPGCLIAKLIGHLALNVLQSAIPDIQYSFSESYIEKAKRRNLDVKRSIEVTQSNNSIGQIIKAIESSFQGVPLDDLILEGTYGRSMSTVLQVKAKNQVKESYNSLIDSLLTGHAAPDMVLFSNAFAVTDHNTYDLTIGEKTHCLEVTRRLLRAYFKNEFPALYQLASDHPLYPK